MKTRVDLTVNGVPYELYVEPNKRLVDVIRDDLGLRGTKLGCGGGECGACTVIMDGAAVDSCLVLAVQAEGRSITTIEGLAKDGKLHPIQEAFIQEGSTQCGFCNPGMILSAKALLDHNPHPDDGEIKHALAGNFCRCTGYGSILRAVKAAAERGSK